MVTVDLSLMRVNSFKVTSRMVYSMVKVNEFIPPVISTLAGFIKDKDMEEAFIRKLMVSREMGSGIWEELRGRVHLLKLMGPRK